MHLVEFFHPSTFSQALPDRGVRTLYGEDFSLLEKIGHL